MPTLINVCGPGRSGTTVLDLMLGNAPNAFSCGEIVRWHKFDKYYKSELTCCCPEGASCSIWSKLKDLPADQFHRRSMEILNADFIVDSSKGPSWILDSNRWAVEQGIKVYNILIYKDPQEHYYSMWKLHKNTRQIIWIYHVYFKWFLSLKLPFLAVNYKDLMANPGAMLEEICSEVGMPYFDGKEQFLSKQPHHVYGNPLVQRQVKSHKDYGDSLRREADRPKEFYESFVKIRWLYENRWLNSMLKDIENHRLNLDSAPINLPQPEISSFGRRPFGYFVWETFFLYRRLRKI